MMFGWWWAAAVFMVICMVLMGRMMMGRSHSAHDEGPGPERRLAERLASGEIDVEEYERLLEALRRTDRTAHT